MPMTKDNKIMIYGPKNDCTYVVELRTTCLRTKAVRHGFCHRLGSINGRDKRQVQTLNRRALWMPGAPIRHGQ